ncbi:imidazolonepropionase-like domain-containing protein [Streptomyces nigrescens]
MLTIHAADAVFGAGPLCDAVAVDGGAIVGVGPLERMTAEWPQARVRRWSGLMMPGLVNHQAAALLEAAYHPDPREADELGTEPITGDALAALPMDDARWGASARRGLQRMLQHGTTAVAGPFHRPPVRTAVARSGLRVRDPRQGRDVAAALDVFAVQPLSAVLGGDLAEGRPADLAVFDVPVDELPARALRLHGAGTCLATVLAGRLVYRRR